jgi:hypothetical protein
MHCLELIVSADGGLLLVIENHGGLGLVSATSGLNRVVAVLHDKLDKGLERSVTVVVDKVSASSRLELESRETGNLEGGARGNIILGGIHLGAIETQSCILEIGCRRSLTDWTHMVKLSLNSSKCSARVSQIGANRSRERK